MTTLQTRAEASWPGSGADTQIPPIAGFIASTFSPLAAEVARRCLSQVTPVPETAVIIVSSSGDVSTAETVAKGERISPLLFFQAVPNAVAGHIAARWDLRGPVVCLSPETPGLEPGLAAARLVIRDGDAAEALVISIEQAEVDSAHAVLVRGVQP